MPLAKTGNGKACTKGCCCGNDFGKKILMTLAGVLLVYLIFYFGTLVRNNMRQYDYIGKAEKSERTLTVSGYGKVSGASDKEILKAQARAKALVDAKKKAKYIAQSLGVDLSGVISYNEYEGGAYSAYSYATVDSSLTKSCFSSSTASSTSEAEINVSVTYAVTPSAY